jgi:prepilin-type N-terminal cleavage/methylation domain-containing protein
MTTHHTEKGFTLVELAIVMTIIGLLIGGILKGQELMENARVTATIAQVRSYEAAVTTFRDAYNTMPGDMATAGTRLPNCTVALCVATTGGTLGDTLIGALNGLGTAANATNTSEAAMFWRHLAHADLITGITDSGTIAWGETFPSAKIGGGFHVGSGDGVTAFVGGGTLQPPGISLVLKALPNVAATTTIGAQALTALRTAQIDRKMDDGNAGTGFVRGYGTVSATGCTNAGAYVENLSGKNCVVLFRIQN